MKNTHVMNLNLPKLKHILSVVLYNICCSYECTHLYYIEKKAKLIFFKQ